MNSSSYSYLIIVKALMPNVVSALYHDLTSADTNPPAWALSGRVWITIMMLILVPLSFLRKLDSLRHTSYIALFSVGMFGPRHVLYCIPLTRHSLPGCNCCILLLLPNQGHSGTRRDPSHQVYVQYYFYIPCAGVCVYMRAERECYPSQSRIPNIDLRSAVPDLQ